MEHSIIGILLKPVLVFGAVTGGLWLLIKLFDKE